MLENITLDSVLKDYYHTISSDNLSEDNIIIDEELQVENSSEKYIIELAKFLNEAFFKGYVISSSILKKLMDVIDYKGYEYQVLMSYINILNKSMNDYTVGEVKPDFERLVLNAQNCINFITKYLEVVKDINSTVVKSSRIPHFKEPNSEATEFNLFVLHEVNYPLEMIVDDITYFDTEKNYDFKRYVDIMRVCYNLDKKLYIDIAYKYKNNFDALFFLLNEDDYTAIDVCIYHIHSFNDLKRLIGAYYRYLEASSIPIFTYTETMIKNIRRIIDVLTINMKNDHLAMILGADFDFWDDVCEKLNRPFIMYDAIFRYRRSPDEYKIHTSFELVTDINKYFGNDKPFFIRYLLLNMDYRDLCGNFVKIFDIVYKNLTIGECYDLISECISGLINLENASVDAELSKLHSALKDLDSYSEELEPIVKYTIDTLSDYLD